MSGEVLALAPMAAAPTLELTAIDLDASPQVRAGLDARVVEDYADLMRAGACFPPLVVFHDEAAAGRWLLADGRHRVAAAQRIGLTEFECEVRPGTFDEALWYALGANREHGVRLTVLDRKHAVVQALAAWPTMSSSVIARQIGVSDRYVRQVREQAGTSSGLSGEVVGTNGKTYPREGVQALKRARIDRAEVARSMPTPPSKAKTPAAAAARLDQMRTMAGEGYSSRQIADAVGMNGNWCRAAMRRAGIEVRADAVMGKTRRIDPNRIVEQMTIQAENLCGDTNLIDFSKLDAAKLPQWVRSLEASRRTLATFIRQLKERAG